MIKEERVEVKEEVKKEKVEVKEEVKKVKEERVKIDNILIYYFFK